MALATRPSVERAIGRPLFLLYIDEVVMFVTISDTLNGLLIPAYVLSREIRGGQDRLHIGLER
jgi:hypothetical protein